MTPDHNPRKIRSPSVPHGQPTIHESTHASGSSTAQSAASTCHPTGTTPTPELNTIIPAAIITDKMSAIRNLRHILGTSRKKFERSTSFLVAPQVML